MIVSMTSFLVQNFVQSGHEIKLRYKFNGISSLKMNNSSRIGFSAMLHTFWMPSMSSLMSRTSLTSSCISTLSKRLICYKSWWKIDVWWNTLLYPHNKVHLELDSDSKPVHTRPYPRLQIIVFVTVTKTPKILLYPVIAVIPQNSPVIPQLGV